MKTKSLVVLGVLPASASTSVANPSHYKRAPGVPSILEVGTDYNVSFRAFATGVQIYTATPSPADQTTFVWIYPIGLRETGTARHDLRR